MKKLLLSFGAILALGLNAQTNVIVSGEGVAGNYAHNVAKAADGWACPDMTDPANVVQDTLKMVVDGTAPNDDACEALTNDLTGKIAVLYRGACEFGLKALNAENAGAVAVILINNVDEDVTNFGMLGGTSGASVTIPVVMITKSMGDAIRDSLAAGDTITAIIGNKTGLYTNDLVSTISMINRPTLGSLPNSILGAAAANFNFDCGASVENVGSGDLTNVTLSIDIKYGGSSVFNQSSTPQNMASGDSVYIDLPDFTPTAGNTGRYEYTYVFSSDATDEFPEDDTIRGYFDITDQSLSLVGTDNMDKPEANVFYSSATPVLPQYCMIFSLNDFGGTNIGADGAYFAATVPVADTLVGLAGRTVYAILESWDDQFTGVSDPALGISSFTEVGYAEYYFDAKGSEEMTVFAQFNTPATLNATTRYRLCLSSTNDNTLYGYNSDFDYVQNVVINDQPIVTTVNDGTTYIRGFGDEIIPAFGVRAGVGVSIDEKSLANLNAFPNPSAGRFEVTYKDYSGEVEVNLYSVDGKLAHQSTETFYNGNMLMNVDLAKGNYIMEINFLDGSATTLKVNITK